MNNIKIFANCSKRLSPTRVRYIFKKSNITSDTPLNKDTTTLLKSTSFNIFLSNLNIYRHFFLHIDIMINYYNNTYKRVSLSKSISKNNSNRYLNIDLTNYIKPIDLNKFKIIYIDIYTKNILLYFSGRSILNTTYINLEFNTLKNYYNFNNISNVAPYYLKNNDIDSPNSKNNNNLPSKCYEAPFNTYNNRNKISNIENKQNTVSQPSPYKSIDIRKLLYKYKKNKFSSLIKKFINKVITVKVEFNGVKILSGTLDKITSDTITIKTKNYKHIICTDSISIISSEEHINTDDLISNSQYSDISVVLNYLKDNNIKLNLNDTDLNISIAEIINSCDSFLEVKDIITQKTYYLNLSYIKTIEAIPNKN